MANQQRPSSPPAQPGIDQSSPGPQPGEERTPASVQSEQKLQEDDRQQGATVPGETLPRTGAEPSEQGRGDLLDQGARQINQPGRANRVDPIGGDTGAQS